MVFKISSRYLKFLVARGMEGCHVTKLEIIYFSLIGVQGFLPALTQLTEFSFLFSSFWEFLLFWGKKALPNFL